MHGFNYAQELNFVYIFLLVAQYMQINTTSMKHAPCRLLPLYICKTGHALGKKIFPRPHQQTLNNNAIIC